MHGSCVFFHGLFLQQTQDLQGTGFRITDHACAIATRAGDVRAFVQGRAQALTRELHQSKARNLAHLYTCTVKMQCVAQTVFNRALVLGVFHVDEVDHDQTTQVTQTQLASDFVGCLLVGAQCCFFDIGAARSARRVHVHGNQRLGVINYDRAARRQIYGARISCFDLVLDLETREKWHIIAITFNARNVIRHDDAHKRHRLISNVVCVDQNLTNIG